MDPHKNDTDNQRSSSAWTHRVDELGPEEKGFLDDPFDPNLLPSEDFTPSKRIKKSRTGGGEQVRRESRAAHNKAEAVDFSAVQDDDKEPNEEMDIPIPEFRDDDEEDASALKRKSTHSGDSGLVQKKKQKYTKNTGKWKPDEVKRFLKGLQKHGKGKWKAIASVVKTRNNNQVMSYARRSFSKLAKTKQTDGNTGLVQDYQKTRDKPCSSLTYTNEEEDGENDHNDSNIGDEEADGLEVPSGEVFGGASSAEAEDKDFPTVQQDDDHVPVEERERVATIFKKKVFYGYIDELWEVSEAHGSPLKKRWRLTYDDGDEESLDDLGVELARRVYQEHQSLDPMNLTDRNTGKWKPDEHDRFLQGLKKYGKGKWAAIALVVKTRDNIQVQSYATRTYFAKLEGEHLKDSGDGKNTGRWKPDEHERFLKGFQNHGMGNWQEIARVVSTRNSFQVQTHWRGYRDRLKKAEQKGNVDRGVHVVSSSTHDNGDKHNQQVKGVQKMC